MSLPITIPFIDTGKHHGIINTLNKACEIDLLGENWVSLSSSEVYTGEISTLVNHGTGHFQSKDSSKSNTYIQVSFLKGYVFPTGYTLKGVKGLCSYSKSWYVYGIHEGDEGDESKWDTLGVNDTTQSTYCHMPNSRGYCDDDAVGSFSLKSMPSSRGYKHLRWKLKDPNDEYYAFITAGIDIYGTLSNNPYGVLRNGKSLCHCNKNLLLVALLFGDLMIS
jgi:hypothetical protein